MSSSHSRRLSQTTDINYGELSSIDTDKPLPEIKKPILSPKSSLRNSNKKKNSVRFNLTPIFNAPAPPPKDEVFITPKKRNHERLEDEFEEFNLNDDDYERYPKPGEPIDENDYFPHEIKSPKGWIHNLLHPNQDTLSIIGCILGWYCFSLGISLYNKWMFDKDNLNFPFPIITTSLHQFLLFWLSCITMWMKPSFRPTVNNSISKFYDYFMDKKLYLLSILPCAIATSGDVGCGNMSFRFITLSLYTMIKSSSIAFVLIFGVLFKLEKFSFKLTSIVSIMIIGVMMMVGGSGDDSSSSKFNHDMIVGSLLVLMASLLSGLRWALTQLVLKKNPYVTNPISTMFYLSPPMFLSLFVVGSMIEKLSNFLNHDIWSNLGVLKSLILLLIPGFLVFFMTVFELKLLQRSHVVTLSIAGIFKELLTIIVSTFIFGDKLTFINCFGLLITLMDIIWYNYYRYTEDGDNKYQKVEDVELRNI